MDTLVTSTIPVSNGLLATWASAAYPDGDYELSLVVADTLGLLGRAVTTIIVDNQFPSARVTSPVLISAAGGGDVYTAPGDAQLFVPPGAFVLDTVVELRPVRGSAVPDTLPVGAAWSGTAFDLVWGTTPSLKSCVLDLAAPPDAEGLVIYHRGSDSTWVRLGGTVNRSSGRISLDVQFDGRYALAIGGTAGSSTPLPGIPLSGVTMTPRIFSPRQFSPSGGGASTLAIGFVLGQAGTADVRVFNRAGRLVNEVARGEFAAGSNLVRWDGRDRAGSAVPEGLYVVTVDALGKQLRNTVIVAP